MDKANVLTTGRFWREIATRVGREEYPDVELEHILVDSAAMYLMRRPASFDVMVTENMFGDILTDEASVLGGSMGMLPSASLGTAQNGSGGVQGLYEPIHGTALYTPEVVGSGRANPIAAVLSAALMLRYSFNREDAAQAVEGAVQAVLDEGYRTADIASAGQGGGGAGAGGAAGEGGAGGEDGGDGARDRRAGGAGANYGAGRGLTRALLRRKSPRGSGGGRVAGELYVAECATLRERSGRLLASPRR